MLPRCPVRGAILTPPGSLFKMQYLRSHPEQVDHNLHFTKIPRGFVFTLQFVPENTCFTNTCFSPPAYASALHIAGSTHVCWSNKYHSFRLFPLSPSFWKRDEDLKNLYSNCQYYGFYNWVLIAYTTWHLYPMCWWIGTMGEKGGKKALSCSIRQYAGRTTPTITNLKLWTWRYWRQLWEVCTRWAPMN